jgi:hypothetical protein
MIPNIFISFLQPREYRHTHISIQSNNLCTSVCFFVTLMHIIIFSIAWLSATSPIFYNIFQLFIFNYFPIFLPNSVDSTLPLWEIKIPFDPVFFCQLLYILKERLGQTLLEKNVFNITTFKF